MNLLDIRTKVREIVDLDATDVSDTLIQLYVKDGFDRIIALERRWPFYQLSTTLNTVANQRAYSVSTIGAGNIREITSIVDTSTIGNRLQWISYDDAEKMWIGNNDSPSRPMYFTLWQEQIHLWPKPEQVYPLIIRAYRKSTNWHLSNSTEADIDERFHNALVYYAVAQIYQLQEDIELASFYRKSFDEAVMLAHSDVMKPSSNRPLALSDGVPGLNHSYWMESLGRHLGQ